MTKETVHVEIGVISGEKVEHHFSAQTINVITSAGELEPYMITRTRAHDAYYEPPRGPWFKDPGAISVAELRVRLLKDKRVPDNPIQKTVTGTFCPCALLVSGWWEKYTEAKVKQLSWRDPIQEWLFQGFEAWGPSWDFTFDLENWDRTNSRPMFIGQLGDGDEANSIPVVVPKTKAKRLQEYLEHAGGRGMAGVFRAEVTGMLGTREQFRQKTGSSKLELFGGMLDFCLWLDEGEDQHCIGVAQDEDLGGYSGYLWKCLSPKAFLKDDQPPTLKDVFFVWEHTDFTKAEALKYNLDSLESKERYLRNKYGDMVLVQKSSVLVPGTPAWPNEDVYRLLVGKSVQRI